MLLSVGDWKFDIDMEATMAYSAAEAREHCTCAYCRNFYAAVDTAYPQLRPFLAQFGLNIEAPEELMPFDDGIYNASYAVRGRILQKGGELSVSGIPLSFWSENCMPGEMYFTVDIGFFQLPWVLDEPAEEVKSPANLPDFLKRMWNKLLGRAEDTSEQ